MSLRKVIRENVMTRLDKGQENRLRSFRLRARKLAGLAAPATRLFGVDLFGLAKLHEVDPWKIRFFLRAYQQHFAAMRDKPIGLLEIGIGGYENPLNGGESLRMWRSYFSEGADLWARHL